MKMHPLPLLAGLLLILVLAFPAPVLAQSDGPVLSYPSAGEALQGVVSVRGTSSLDGFVRAELAFAYSSDPTGTWFLIATFDQPAVNEVLAAWDTTVITDGDYVLRLRVVGQDGATQETLVPGVRVRNYTAVETATPPPEQAAPSPTATPQPAATPGATATPRPPNPAEVSPADVGWSLAIGGGAAVSVLLLLGVYQWVRRKRS